MIVTVSDQSHYSCLVTRYLIINLPNRIRKPVHCKSCMQAYVQSLCKRLSCFTNLTFMTQSDKTNLIARKYTHVYNYTYLLFCVCYSNSVSFIQLLRSFCIHGEACAKILCPEKELLNLKDSKLTQNFYGNKTGFVRPGHILICSVCIPEFPFFSI